MHFIDHYAPHTNFLELPEEPSAGCDPDFDTADDDLEREVQELRLQLANVE